MSQLLINEYLNKLDRIKKGSGSTRETTLREAFKTLLEAWSEQHKLLFLSEQPLRTATKSIIQPDGVVLHALRVPLGYWEAKDADDDLNEEINKKFTKGYPKDNIIFSDDVTAVLWQNREELMRCDMTNRQELAKLLSLFFEYERPEIAGFCAAVEQFKKDLPDILKALREMIECAHQANARFRKAEETFLAHAREAINPNMGATNVREMLIQHILTEEIFAKVFNESDFHQHNNVARELYSLEAEFFTGSLKKQTLKGLEPYYAAIRSAADLISGHNEKQAFLKVIYENFYKVYNPKEADKLGVVYTPNEIVRFMVKGADWLTEKYFGKTLIDEDVEILDPATGTGTFICELLEHFRGNATDLRRKYLNELYANEVAILPYYVANLNIEATYAAISEKYEEFPNLCFVDTLDNVGLHTAARGTTIDMFGSVSEENVARIKRQNSKRISVIIGNPPYNANQVNENDNNKNREYPSIDKRIKDTYIHESKAQKTKLYDMFARFFRWASDRLSDNGVLAFVTNRSFIDKGTFDGFRKTVEREFSEIYLVDLGGDVRANPKLSGSKHNVFGIQTGVAISFMVKRVNRDRKSARVFYVRRPEMETAEEKLGFLAHQPMSSLNFEEVKPDKAHNWLDLTNNDFDTLIPLANKETKAAKTAGEERALFKLFSIGQATNRDEWVYDFNSIALLTRMKFFIDSYSTQKLGNEYTQTIKWSRNLKRSHGLSRAELLNKHQIRLSVYRPYVKVFVYDSPLFVDERGAVDEIFPMSGAKNVVIAMNSTNTTYWNCLAIDTPIDLNAFYGGSRSFPLYRYNDSDNRTDNITDWGLKQFQERYEQVPAAGGVGSNARPLTKESIFHYCYAVLHDPVYREKYALNLKRELPRIPLYADFWQWATWGRELVELHVNYESVEPFALQRTDVPDEKALAAGLQPKAMLRANKDSGSIALDGETSLCGIPSEAWDYKLGNRCALEWVLDQYKEKKPKDSTIRDKFNTYRFADYKKKVIDLLERVTTVSVETQRIIKAMRGAKR